MKALLGVWCWGFCFGLCGIARADSADAALARFESTQAQMGVPFKVILYAPDEATANRAFQAAFSRISQLNRILSDFDTDSELSRLSHTGPAEKGVPVSDPLWLVLYRSQDLAVQSGGAFDVTVGPYVRLWRRARRSKEMPSPERLAEARDAVGYQHLKLDEQHHTAQLLKPNMRLDLGGIAMGYAVDETLKILRERKITRALVDASGDIGVGDPPPGKQGWTIGVIPLSTAGTPNKQILLANAAVSTAGDALQHVDIDGKRYSHIVDPHTGLGLTDRTAVTVIAGDCITADGLDTAINVMGPKAGLELIEKTPGTAAFIVRATDDEPQLFESRRFKMFVVPDQN
ncbi:MAG: FAD:protein FMN transferase [Planctomycetia bacterium]|nr:FAD:protein FMN transferase [Planctomycetia bacterium]